MRNININVIDSRKMKDSIWDKIDDTKEKLDKDLLERELGSNEVSNPKPI